MKELYNLNLWHLIGRDRDLAQSDAEDSGQNQGEPLSRTLEEVPSDITYIWHRLIWRSYPAVDPCPVPTRFPCSLPLNIHYPDPPRHQKDKLILREDKLKTAQLTGYVSNKAAFISAVANRRTGDRNANSGVVTRCQTSLTDAGSLSHVYLGCYFCVQIFETVICFSLFQPVLSGIILRGIVWQQVIEILSSIFSYKLRYIVTCRRIQLLGDYYTSTTV